MIKKLGFSLGLTLLTMMAISFAHGHKAYADWCNVIGNPSNGSTSKTACLSGQNDANFQNLASLSGSALTNQFINDVNANLSSSYPVNQVGAQYIVNHLQAKGGNWQDNVKAASLSIGNIPSQYKCQNTAYDPSSNTVVPDTVDCESDTALIITSGGQYVFILRLQCGNPMGNLSGPPPADNPPSGTLSVACASGGYTFTYTFKDADGNSGDHAAGFLVSGAYGSDSDAGESQNFSYTSASSPYTSGSNTVTVTGAWPGTVSGQYHDVWLKVRDVTPGTDTWQNGANVGQPSCGTWQVTGQTGVQINGGSPIYDATYTPVSVQNTDSVTFVHTLTNSTSIASSAVTYGLRYQVNGGAICTWPNSGGTNPAYNSCNTSWASPQPSHTFSANSSYGYSNGGSYMTASMNISGAPSGTTICEWIAFTPTDGSGGTNGASAQQCIVVGSSQQQCPAGETGTPPNCTTPQCPAGEVGTPPNCTKPTQPENPNVTASASCSGITGQVTFASGPPATVNITAQGALMPNGIFHYSFQLSNPFVPNTYVDSSGNINLPYGAKAFQYTKDLSKYYSLKDIVGLGFTNFDITGVPSDGSGSTGDYYINVPTNCSTPPPALTPFFNVLGGDVAAGPGFTGLTPAGNGSADITGENHNNQGGDGSYFGAGSQLGALATGNISSFVTALGNTLGGGLPPYVLSFANSGSGVSVNNSGSYGGKFGSVNPVPNYYADASSGVTQTQASNLPTPNTYSLTTDLPSGNTVAVNINGNITLNGGTLPQGKHVVLAVAGNVYITSNIVYAAYANTSQIPSFQLIVQGNIYVAPGVSELHGLYVAEPTSSTDTTNGLIATCANQSGALTGSAASSGTTNCGTNQLVIYGAVAARKLKLGRGMGDSNNSSTSAAEIFQFTPELWVASSGSTSVGTNWQSVTSLPPIL